jgi:hypothetical protein
MQWRSVARSINGLVRIMTALDTGRDFGASIRNGTVNRLKRADDHHAAQAPVAATAHRRARRVPSQAAKVHPPSSSSGNQRPTILVWREPAAIHGSEAPSCRSKLSKSARFPRARGSNLTTATEVQYETRSVKTIRGLETRTRAKIEKDGWEFVSQTPGALRSELIFRRPKPKTPWRLLGIGGGVFVLIIVVLLIVNALGGGSSESDGAKPSPAPSVTQVAPTEATTPSAEPAPAPAVRISADITVDELLDKLNSAEMGGIKVGDTFRLTGELFMSDLWMTGATGDYFVMLKAQGGAQDLPVFVEESDAAGWQDGTKLEMVVEMVEASINGETTDGWLRAQTVTTVP